MSLFSNSYEVVNVEIFEADRRRGQNYSIEVMKSLSFLFVQTWEGR